MCWGWEGGGGCYSQKRDWPLTPRWEHHTLSCLPFVSPKACVSPNSPLIPQKLFSTLSFPTKLVYKPLSFIVPVATSLGTSICIWISSVFSPVNHSTPLSQDCYLKWQRKSFPSKAGHWIFPGTVNYKVLMSHEGSAKVTIFNEKTRIPNCLYSHVTIA